MRKFLIVGLLLGAMAGLAEAQVTTPRRRSIPIPAPTATPDSDPMIISRAEDFPDENSRAIPPDPAEGAARNRANLQTLEELGNRIKNLEGAAAAGAGATVRKPDPDEKQKRLLLNLDILSRAEQRSEALRKQVFEMMEKENAVKTKLDSLHTAVADTYVKLGFRYRAYPKTVEYYVNGVMPGGTIAPARLTQSEVGAATFPTSSVPMAPVIGIKDIAGNAALTLKLDWWGAAQMY